MFNSLNLFLISFINCVFFQIINRVLLLKVKVKFIIFNPYQSDHLSLFLNKRYKVLGNEKSSKTILCEKRLNWRKYLSTKINNKIDSYCKFLNSIKFF